MINLFQTTSSDDSHLFYCPATTHHGPKDWDALAPQIGQIAVLVAIYVMHVSKPDSSIGDCLSLRYVCDLHQDFSSTRTDPIWTPELRLKNSFQSHYFETWENEILYLDWSSTRVTSHSHNWCWCVVWLALLSLIIISRRECFILSRWVWNWKRFYRTRTQAKHVCLRSVYQSLSPGCSPVIRTELNRCWFYQDKCRKRKRKVILSVGLKFRQVLRFIPASPKQVWGSHHRDGRQGKERFGEGRLYGDLWFQSRNGILKSCSDWHSVGLETCKSNDQFEIHDT